MHRKHKKSEKQHEFFEKITVFLKNSDFFDSKVLKTIEVIKGNSVYRIMPVIMKQIVFTKKEVQELSGVSTNVVSKIIDQLVDLRIIVPDSSVVKKGYRYQRIYEVFVGAKE